jgi:hypothetical protein
MTAAKIENNTEAKRNIYFDDCDCNSTCKVAVAMLLVLTWELQGLTLEPVMFSSGI